MNNNYITVTQLTKYIKYKIDNDQNLNKIYLKGEISNFKAHTRGHFYFTLKDENSRINAVMFSTYAKDVKFDIQDGMKVLVTGKISVYEATGGYQIYVDELMVDGSGMCGACRCKVDGKVKFACIHGPEFPGDKVDFDLALKRMNIYKEEEKVLYEKMQGDESNE